MHLCGGRSYSIDIRERSRKTYLDRKYNFLDILTESLDSKYGWMSPFKATRYFIYNFQY